MPRFRLRLFVFLLSGAALSVPGGVCAQNGKTFSQAAKAALGKQTLQLPAVLPRAAARLESAAARAVRPMPADIRLSVAKLESFYSLKLSEKMRPTATAFVLKAPYKGKDEVWAVTAGHIAKGFGQTVKLFFYNGDREIEINGKVVQHGPNLLSDAALIKLTDPLPPQIKPLALAETVQPGEKLASAGYVKHQLYYTKDRFLQKDNSRFLRTDFDVPENLRAGLCGGPLLTPQGLAAGIHCGSAFMESRAYAAHINIVPYLIKAYHEGTAEIPLVMGPWNFGPIRLSEHIHSVEALDANGRVLWLYQVENQLHQSTVLDLFNKPQTRSLRFLLEDRGSEPTVFDMKNEFRHLIYDKEQKTVRFEPVTW